MKSNEAQEVFELAKDEVTRGLAKLDPQIDEMTSASLKRVLKAITFVSMADDLVNGNKVELQENEKRLIDSIFKFQETMIGFTSMLDQQQDNNEGGQNV